MMAEKRRKVGVLRSHHCLPKQRSKLRSSAPAGFFLPPIRSGLPPAQKQHSPQRPLQCYALHDFPFLHIFIRLFGGSVQLLWARAFPFHDLSWRKRDRDQERGWETEPGARISFISFFFFVDSGMKSKECFRTASRNAAQQLQFRTFQLRFETANFEFFALAFSENPPFSLAGCTRAHGSFPVAHTAASAGTITTSSTDHRMSRLRLTNALLTRD